MLAGHPPRVLSAGNIYNLPACPKTGKPGSSIPTHRSRRAFGSSPHLSTGLRRLSSMTSPRPPTTGTNMRLDTLTACTARPPHSNSPAKSANWRKDSALSLLPEARPLSRWSIWRCSGAATTFCSRKVSTDPTENFPTTYCGGSVSRSLTIRRPPVPRLDLHCARTRAWFGAKAQAR